MNRIALGTLGLLIGLLGANQLSAQSTPPLGTPPLGTQPLEPQARVLNRSYASVAPTANAIQSDESDAAEASSIAGSFPSLQPQSAAGEGKKAWNPTSKPLAGSLVTVGSSLVVVLGLFAGLVWVTRRFGARSMSQGAIPSEVMQALGSAPMDSRTNITLVRCGNRILVLARTATGIQPLSEITDPNEVRHLTALCLGDSKKEFASTLREIENEKVPGSYVGDTAQPSTPRSRGRLFATA